MNQTNLQHLSLRPVDAALAASLGNRAVKRVRRVLQRQYNATHDLLGEISFEAPFKTWDAIDPERLMNYRRAAATNLARAQVASRLVACLPATLQGVKARREARDNLDVSMEVLEVVDNIQAARGW